MVPFNSIPMYLVMDQNIFNFAFFLSTQACQVFNLAKYINDSPAFRIKVGWQLPWSACIFWMVMQH